jgi:hypothetical protein
MSLIYFERKIDCQFWTNHRSAYFCKELLLSILSDVNVRLHDAVVPIKELVSTHVSEVQYARGRAVCALCEQ